MRQGCLRLWSLVLPANFFCAALGSVHSAHYSEVRSSGQVEVEALQEASRGANLKPWLRRESQESLLEVDSADISGSTADSSQGQSARQPKPDAVFGNSEASPALAKVMVASEVNKNSDMLALTAALHRREDNLAGAFAFAVIGQFTFVMMILYLLNSTDADVRGLSWSTLNLTVSMIIGLVLFMSTRALKVMITGEADVTNSLSIGLAWGRYLAVSALAPLLIWKASARSDLQLEAWSSILTWFTAFCAMNANMLLMMRTFSQSTGFAFLGVVVCSALVLFVFLLSAGDRRRRLGKASDVVVDGVSEKEKIQRWSDACDEMETKVVGAVTSLVLSMFVRYGITWTMPLSPTGRTSVDAKWLSLWTILAFLIGSVQIAAVARFEQSDRSYMMKICSLIGKYTPSMFIAWMVVWMNEWQYRASLGSTGSSQIVDMSVSMNLALYSSVIFLGIMAMAGRVGNGSRIVLALMLPCQFAIAFSWQRVFLSACKYVGSQYKREERYIDILVLWCVCAVAAPSWTRFLLPVAMDSKPAEEETSEEGEEEKAAAAAKKSEAKKAEPAPDSTQEKKKEQEEKKEDDDEDF
eukprot:TRINITY_DN27765_c0_g1_i1.p1 TRINITY_DN27765_c0_g1~~TRINITY_DN27765_c0_g1_i1.p1  ORF type:complete len:630 (-),score=125.18 TRINITY_DN27765_c0_g1_i1:39-1784(-)